MCHSTGVNQAIPTPFMRNGDLDETELKNPVAYYEIAGVKVLLSLGIIGEFATMSGKERRRAAEIIVNAGCAFTWEMIEMDGDMKKTLAPQGMRNDIITAMNVGTFPAAARYMFTKKGLPGGYVRSPREELSDADRLIGGGYIRDGKALRKVVV